MREIKFRAESGGEFVYGLVSYDEDGDVILTTELGWTFDIDEETIGQYTGLKDKNGVEIYEGDIVKHWKQGNRVVVYPLSENYAGYGLVSRDGMRNTLNDGDKLYEVIGNIHQSPELLRD